MSIVANAGPAGGLAVRTAHGRSLPLRVEWLAPGPIPFALLEQLAALSHRAVMPPSGRAQIRRRLLQFPAIVASVPRRVVAALYLIPTNRAMAHRDALISQAPDACVTDWQHARHLNVVHCELDPSLPQGDLLHHTTAWALRWLHYRLGRSPRVMTLTPVTGLRMFCMQLCAGGERTLWPALMRLSESGQCLRLDALAQRLGNLHDAVHTLAFGTCAQWRAFVERDPGAADMFLSELARLYLCEVCRIDDGSCLCKPAHWHQQAGARLARIRALSWMAHLDALSVVAHFDYRLDQMADLAQRYADAVSRRARQPARAAQDQPDTWREELDTKLADLPKTIPTRPAQTRARTSRRIPSHAG